MKIEAERLDKRSADEFCCLRMDLFRELEEIDQTADDHTLRSATKQYYLSHINRDLICWGIRQNGKLVAVGSLCLFTRIPYIDNLTGLEGYILSIYTSPPFRTNGFANQILDKIIDYASNNGINRLWLHSSVNGKALYVKRGFVHRGDEMELVLPKI